MRSDLMPWDNRDFTLRLLAASTLRAESVKFHLRTYEEPE